MKTKIIIAIMLISLPGFAISQKQKYIGYKHKGMVFGETLPNGVKDLGGGLLSNENYGVTRFSKGKKYMLWLEKITSRDAKGIPNWEVTDVLSFKTPKRNQEFLISYSSPCEQNGKPNLDLVVMAERSAKNRTYKVIQAWKANIKEEKFEKISTKKIVCKYVEK